MSINYQTTFACQNAIRKARNEIEQYKNEIRRREEMITQLEKRIAEIEAYQDDTSIEQRTLKRNITSSTKTVDLLDEFETITAEGIKKYSRILDTGAWNYKKYRRYQFIIERVEGRQCVGDITMTNYKNQKGIRPLLDYAKKHIQEYLDENVEDDVDDLPVYIIFDKPYLLRGQKSSNRRGYGSEYNGSSLIKQGTLYGETTNYAIVGVKYIEWKS